MPNFPLAILSETPLQKKLKQALDTPQVNHFKTAVGSGRTLALARCFQQEAYSLLWVLENPEQAAYYLNDLEELLGTTTVLFFPASYRQAYVSEATDNANVLLRAEVLRKLTNSKRPRIIVTYPQAVFEKVISQHTLKKNTLKVQKGTALSLDFINETLF